jgi:hypothetical protein
MTLKVEKTGLLPPWLRGCAAARSGGALRRTEAPYRYATIQAAIVENEGNRLRSASNPLAGKSVGPFLIMGPREYALATEVLRCLQMWLDSCGAGENAVSQRFKREYTAASSGVAYLRQVAALLRRGKQIKEVAESIFPVSALAFCCILINDPDVMVRQAGRDLLFANFMHVSPQTRSYILNDWSVGGTLGEIVGSFSSDSPGKLARLGAPLTLVELQRLPELPFEVAGVQLDGRNFLVRGTDGSVSVPAGGELIFHTHPSREKAALFPSPPVFTASGLSGDLVYNPEMAEYGYLVTPFGITCYSGEAFSRDSYVPFCDVLTKLSTRGAAAFGGTLSFRSHGRPAHLPLLFFSWDFLGQVQAVSSHALMPLPPLLLSAAGDLSSELQPAPGIGAELTDLLGEFELERGEGTTFHPEPQYSHATGRYRTVAFFRRK